MSAITPAGDAAPAAARTPAPVPTRSEGHILVDHELEDLIHAGSIASASGPTDVLPQVQPASLDLRLGERAHRVRAGFLPTT
ncbi:MAG: 2'-deoxycytidine 5'-triphosphate deaminase, partial [Planctomycetota bacterium]|nr:2'-deoxycytidine 5'-triphosphate deaminase [Planctomycetota bacterium]